MNSDVLIKQYCKKLRLGMNFYENYSKISAADHDDFQEKQESEICWF